MHFLTKKDVHYFESLFEDTAGSLNGELSFSEFQQQILSFPKFHRNSLNISIDKLVRKLKNTMKGHFEPHEFYVSKKSF